jgi:hypothetical protein
VYFSASLIFCVDMRAKPFLEVHPERLAGGYKGMVEKITWEKMFDCSGEKNTEIINFVAKLRFQRIYEHNKYIFVAAGIGTEQALRDLYFDDFKSLKHSDAIAELLSALNSSAPAVFQFRHLDNHFFSSLAKWKGRQKLLRHYGWSDLPKISYRKLKSKFIYLFNRIWKDPVVHQIAEIPPEQAILVDCSSLFDVSRNFGGSEEAMVLRLALEDCLRDKVGIDEPSDTIPSVPTVEHQLQSEQALQRRREFYAKIRAIKKEGFNGLLTFKYFDLSNHKRDAELTSLSRRLFDDIEQIEELLALILRCFGDYQFVDETSASPLPLRHYVVTALLTKETRAQNAHLDYSIGALLGRRNKDRRISDGPKKGEPFPWSADIPLSEGGMFLAIWHGFKESFAQGVGIPVENWSMKLHIPFGWILLWRGDLVHAGGFQNGPKNGALRVHWYIYMKQADRDLDYGRNNTTWTDFEDGQKIYNVCRHLEEAESAAETVVS